MSSCDRNFCFSVDQRGGACMNHLLIQSCDWVSGLRKKELETVKQTSGHHDQDHWSSGQYALLNTTHDLWWFHSTWQEIHASFFNIMEDF